MEKIKIGVEVNKDVAKVWESYTMPEHIVNWNFASDDWCCPRAENDLKVGGKYNARMEAKDGSFGFDFTATYDNIEEGKLISYSLDDGRKVITTFEYAGDKTKVETVFEAENSNPIEMQRDGWQAILNNFKKHTEKL
ncbi:MAG: SRPBCC family protein [Ignavibacteria bacterium]|nr:SRPBCC family protein [Ignavibacteria bacterium]HCN37898.1 activator of HSP90 ATPase [Bacteroidota bacterium]